MLLEREYRCFCDKCSEFSVLKQVEAKECMILSYKMLYHTLKHDLENYKLEDVKEMYSYLEEDLFSVLNGYYESIQRLEKEIEELKLHKDVRLHFCSKINGVDGQNQRSI